jgi:putative Ca2+/H+ antiporter (TMEM165/GDT1 family)
MDALLNSLIAVLLAETGDRTQILAAVLAMRFGNNRAVTGGLAVATAVNCFLAATAGSLIDGWVSEEPVRLFTALSFIFAGIAMWAGRKKVDVLGNWKNGAFFTSTFGLLILEFGDKSQFLVLAQAANTPHWMLSALGGWMGIMIACVPAILLREKLAEMLPLKKIRLAGGAVLLLWGVYMLLSTFKLIG